MHGDGGVDVPSFPGLLRRPPALFGLFCSAVVVVWAPPAVQRARMVARDGLSPGEADARLAAQLPIDEKAARADFVVENAGDRSALEAKADRLLADLRGRFGCIPGEAIQLRKQSLQPDVIHLRVFPAGLASGGPVGMPG